MRLSSKQPCPSPSLVAVAAVVAPAVVADVMSDVTVVGRVVPFLAASVIPCSRPIQGIPPLWHLFSPSLALRLRQPLCPPLLLLSSGPSMLLPLCRCRIVAILVGPTPHQGGLR
jgi:hypothetical protein